jgi:GDP-4-dehydro-6-deoxy-D-mannose reductase
VDGTRALAAALMRHAPECRLVHVSSGEVYGLSFNGGAPLDEGAPLRPANPYAAAKAAADLALGEMALRGLRVVRLRPLNHVGPGQSARFAVAAFARQIARIEAGAQPPVVRTGALDRRRDFLDVRDVCDAYVSALERADALPAGAVLNVASGRLRRLGEVLADMLRLSGVRAEVEQEEAALRPTDLAATPCSAEAARAALGWAPRRDWDATLAEIIASWRGGAAEARA